MIILEIAALQKLGQIDGKCEKRYHDNTFESKFVTVCYTYQQYLSFGKSFSESYIYIM